MHVQRAIRSVIVALMRNDVVRLRYRTVILRVCWCNESHITFGERQFFGISVRYSRSLVSLTRPTRILPFRLMAVSGRATTITPVIRTVPETPTLPTSIEGKCRSHVKRSRRHVFRISDDASPRDRRASKGNSKRELRNAKVSSEFLACLKAAYRRYRSRANVPAIILTRNITRSRQTRMISQFGAKEERERLNIEARYIMISKIEKVRNSSPTSSGRSAGF